MRAYYRRRRGTPEADPCMSLVVQPTVVEDPDELPQAWRMPVAFEGRQVRITTDEHGVAWFVAADVCAALGLGNSRQAITRLDEDERGVVSTDTPYGKQPMNAVNEPGLYSLVLSSRKPEAKRFKRWVTHEVLPAIRRTGRYAPQPAPQRLPLPEGVHVVASNPTHGNLLWMQAVENDIMAALRMQFRTLYGPMKGTRWHGPTSPRQPSYQLHLLP